MTDKVKDFLAALDRLENDALSNRDGYGYSSGDAETIRRVLAENEKLRKERDELINGFQYLDALHKELGIVDLTKETARCREIAKKVNKNGNA